MEQESAERERLSPSEEAEFLEFKRARRETEISFVLKKLFVDASRRETDGAALKRACECAVKLHAAGVCVSPVNVAAAKRLLARSDLLLSCPAGGTGESLVSVKKTEAKKAARQGAGEIRLVLCYSRLAGGGFHYLKREVRRVRKGVKKKGFVVSLEDRSLGEEEIALGVRAACAGGADGVCVRGEVPLVLKAVSESAGKLRVEVSGVENAEQLRMLFKAGAERAVTACAEAIAEELYAGL